MSRKFIAAVLAVSTTIAAFSAAPARAGNDADIARILGAAATIFVIGKAIENARDDNRRDDRSRGKKDRYEDPYPRKNKPTVQYNYHQPVPQVIPRNVRPQHGKAPLPAQCVRRVDSGKTKRVVMENCLERNYRSARELPRACKILVGTKRGNAGAYALPCLKLRGYELARN
jgi:hypothetical protein